MNHSETVNFLWNIANLIRDSFRRSKYPDVILPFTVLRRIDGVLAESKENVLAANGRFQGQISPTALDQQLRRASGLAFYNTSRYDFARLLDDPPHIAANLRNYITGFSDNMREVIEKFDFYNTIDKLDESGLLFLVLQEFNKVDLTPARINNHEMGTVFEELIRKFNEASNENPGEHFTPRDVVNLMAALLLDADRDGFIAEPHISVTISDPCCGTGGMLTIAKDRIEAANGTAVVHLFGQEVNPETYAMAKSDLYMKSADGRDAENIHFGSTLSADAHPDRRFNYQLANPPYGKDWRMDATAVNAETARGAHGRFGAGTPRSSDGQLLFLQHMIARMHPPGAGHSRVAIIMNGSPLFTGDAGSGESEIRRWILENDWLAAIIALPESLFYNTGIGTYVWLLSSDKTPERHGQVLLVDATELWTPMRKSLGDKRREISGDQQANIVALVRAFQKEDKARLFQTTDFGYRKITVERPLRLNFHASPGRIESLPQQRAFQNLAKSRKKDLQAKASEEEVGRAQQQALLTMLATLPGEPFDDRSPFDQALTSAARQAGIKLSAPLRKAIHAALSERDENAAICLDKKGQPEADSSLRDTERIPLDEDIEEFFNREVLPYVPDAWINKDYRDAKDGQIGRVGYEINFNRYFYEYTPPRPLADIEADIRASEQRIMELLRQVTEVPGTSEVPGTWESEVPASGTQKETHD